MNPRSFTGRTPLLTLALLLLAAGTVLSQQQPSLAEIARKEQERRRAVAEPARVYTNEDLRGGGRLTTAAVQTTPADAAAGLEPADDADGRPPDDRAGEEGAADLADAPRDEAYWRSLVADVREEIERNRLLREALRSRISALTTDFVNRDDPAQRAVIEQDRDQAIAELSRVEGDIGRLEQQLRDVEEDARRTGVPPGWLR